MQDKPSWAKALEIARTRRWAGHVPEYVVDAETGCWVWQRYTMKNGYGSMRADGRTSLAHRVYYERHVGPIPEGFHIDHLCRNRPCVNPEHMQVVTFLENVHRGSSSQLTPYTAFLIRWMKATTQIEPIDIAEVVGTSRSNVYSVLRNRKWRLDGLQHG